MKNKYNHNKKITTEIVDISYKEYMKIKDKIKERILNDTIEGKQFSFLMEEVEDKILNGDIKLLRYVLLHWLFSEKKEFNEQTFKHTIN